MLLSSFKKCLNKNILDKINDDEVINQNTPVIFQFCSASTARVYAFLKFVAICPKINNQKFFLCNILIISPYSCTAIFF